MLMSLVALRSDIHRQFGQFSWRNAVVGFLTLRNLRALVTMRLCQHAWQSGGVLRAALPLLKLAHRLTTWQAVLDLPWRTSIGPGFAITHGWGAVVSSGAVIGSNVTLFHGATLGRRDKILSNGERVTVYPVIADDVWIGPHAIIVGGVTVGEGSRIAGGAFVTKDVPPHSIVVGNPATVVAADCEPDVFNRAPVP